MIEVIVNRPSFEYDIHSLVKSFFPREDVQIHVQDTFTEDTALRISVEFTDETVSICLMEQGEEKESGASVINYAERKETKNRLKRQLYQLLCAYTGQTLPWGTLTGIRPAKIAMGLIEQGMSNVETAEYMRNTYLASKEKVALSVMIANRERYVLRNIDYKDGYSLYVGIPFCPSICLYCSFSSYPLERWRKQVDQYLDALCKELDYVADRFRDKKLNTVYIGGGTPTTLEPYQLDRLLTRIQSKFDTEHLQEFTVEAGRPDSITRAPRQYYGGKAEGTAGSRHYPYLHQSPDHEPEDTGDHRQTSHRRSGKRSIYAGPQHGICSYQYGSDRGTSGRIL